MTENHIVKEEGGKPCSKLGTIDYQAAVVPCGESSPSADLNSTAAGYLLFIRAQGRRKVRELGPHPTAVQAPPTSVVTTKKNPRPAVCRLCIVPIKRMVFFYCTLAGQATKH